MKATVKAYIERELLRDDRPLADDDNLLLTGRVDSVGMMSLVLFLEDTFGLDVPPEDVTIENFLSLDTIEAYLSQRGATA